MDIIRYDLSPLYKGFDSEEFQNDLKVVETSLKELTEFVKQELVSYDDFESKLEKILKFETEQAKIIGKIMTFISLTLSADTTNTTATKYQAKVQMMLSDATGAFTSTKKYIGKFTDLDKIIKKAPFNEFAFYLTEIRDETSHLLSDEIEQVISKMRQNGSSAWNQLQSLLTSKVQAEVELETGTKTMTLSEIISLSRSNDPKVRKAAYIASQKAYKTVEDAIAMSLSCIKGEVNYTSKLRGYESALDESLAKSRTRKETLDAMLKAMYEYLPHFHKYLKRKAKLLGYNSGLPSYELSAPIGDYNRQFTYEEAKEFIIANFRTFSDKLARLAEKAFKNNWIDVYPRVGKRGGAFCSNIPSIKQSRILTNFNGNLKDVITIAHELGHAYHGECIFLNHILNSGYPMPVAETASTFNETIVVNAILNSCSPKEKLSLIEGELQGHTAIICDILSRYLFESEVFERRLDHPLNSNELQEIMKNAIKEAYGDGLDHEYSNPYAWLNKPHYYRPNLSFYNWPYAFGLLFAKGLYAVYLKDKQSFVESYDKLLSATGTMNVEDVAREAGIDVTDINFWRGSLELIKENIDTFLKITE